jgi:hypothetical protein
MNTKLIELLFSCTKDPLRFALVAFPWGMKGTPLEAYPEGPDEWARELFSAIRDSINKPAAELMPFKAAVASGHGIGKSCTASILVLWAMMTRPNSKGIVTANTDDQLIKKTWPEVAKWFELCLFKHLFKITDTAILSRDPKLMKTWRYDKVTWSEHNTEAFAGLHNQGSRLLLLFDEASAISEKVWEVAEGALTDKNTEILWIAFGNPTRTSGRFFECFHKRTGEWWTRQVDSRSVRISNKAQLQKMIDENGGEDSDFARVRIRGLFPNDSTDNFMSPAAVAAARKREAIELPQDAIVLGVDVARFGTDRSVIAFRKGNNLRWRKHEVYQGRDLMWVAGRVAELHRELSPDAIFIDGSGVGGGVIDRLAQLGIGPVYAIDNGGKAHKAEWANMGAQCWGNFREVLPRLSLPDDEALASELTSRGYSYDQSNRIRLESKDKMKERGLASPDLADAYCLCFSWPTGPRDPRKAFAQEQGVPMASQARVAHNEFSPY